MRDAILREYEHDAPATLDVIRERYNCGEAEIDADGDVWIADPQTGHWLDEDALAELARYGREHYGWDRTWTAGEVEVWVERHGGNVTHLAVRLGLERTQLQSFKARGSSARPLPTYIQAHMETLDRYELPE